MGVEGRKLTLRERFRRYATIVLSEEEMEDKERYRLAWKEALLSEPVRIVSTAPLPKYKAHQRQSTKPVDLDAALGFFSEEDMEEIKRGARGRTPAAIERLRVFLSALSEEYPVRCLQMSEDLEWLLDQVEKRGMTWD